MENKFQQTLIAVVSLLAIGGVCVAGTVSCSQINQRYYEGMKACLDQGGSWVPQGGQGGYSSSCINPHAREK